MLALLSLGINAYSQTVDADGNLTTNSHRYLKDLGSERLEGWLIKGNNSLQFNQAAFSNWMAGGVNSYALNANIDYEFNLTRGRHIWDNRVILAYGILRNEGEDYRKSNDVIDITSSYGYEVVKHLYLAASTNFKTQFSEGFDYEIQDAVTGDYKKISSFMSPGYWSLGIGLDYKPTENLQVNFHPLTSRFTFVTDPELQFAGNYGLKADGDSYFYEFGAYLGARYKFNIMENISYDSRLGIYSNYLDTPQNMDVAYQGILDMKVNSWISAQATINLFYDEDQIKKTQLKETLGVGLSYKIDNTEKLKQRAESLKEIAPETIAPEVEAEAEAAATEAVEEAAAEVAEEATEAETTTTP